MTTKRSKRRKISIEFPENTAKSTIKVKVNRIKITKIQGTSSMFLKNNEKKRLDLLYLG
jgi:hypothetical protein